MPVVFWGGSTHSPDLMQNSGAIPFAKYEKYSLGFHKHCSIVCVEIGSSQELCETHVHSDVMKEAVGDGWWAGGGEWWAAGCGQWARWHSPWALLSELQALRWVLEC